MSNEMTFEKELTANDTGETKSHQAGIHIPKCQKDLLAFLPELDPSTKNPDAWLVATDDEGIEWKFRYVYYNNKFHSDRGTRDEYRITHMTKALRALGAREGEILSISGIPRSGRIRIKIRRENDSKTEVPQPVRVKLVGWRRVH
ncbi:EcoRII N-terminal effector-binding domain-containing protein [Alisedimentitalea sp. MJ-SS2]|uniref:EcoRII N-terminal effector-binding domain-containing protein n=1 Tax=Aliisedimentitalea sp. MJ-SS2 TaxID=3049795 RepID=UPI002908ADCF|nr:EcoRII N-terminal effector-binding domain-containing protein [Alisedimentitalea sp. MJ-SS2]MDU8927678.1 EcoRII N-terminal effector-binding domain-containing protein [Alisedimentitalea sp. MJ-SS2]